VTLFLGRSRLGARWTSVWLLVDRDPSRRKEKKGGELTEISARHHTPGTSIRRRQCEEPLAADEHLLVNTVLVNTVLVNRRFASIQEMEGAQAERCVSLQIHRWHGPRAH
jgi:hypothetical protein